VQSRLVTLKRLRKWIVDVNDQATFEKILLPDDEGDMNPIQRNWAFLQWEIDEEIRELAKDGAT
jgi:hypothetical protein